MKIINVKGWNYVYGGLDWPKTCQIETSKLQGPIDISPPFEEAKNYPTPLNYKFNYGSSPSSNYIYYINENNLIIEGDFGYVELNNQIYHSTNLFLYSPSLHTFKNKRYPLELQVINKNENGELVTNVILFKESKTEFNNLLSKLGFNNINNKYINPYKIININDQIDLQNYIHNNDDFIIYDSYSMIPNCDKKNLVFISTNILYANEIQIKNFPLSVKFNNRIIQRRLGRKIYLTLKFGSNEMIEKINKLNKTINENNKTYNDFEYLNNIMENHTNEEVLLYNNETSNNHIINSNKTEEQYINFEIIKKISNISNLSQKKIEPNFIELDSFNKSYNYENNFPLSQSEKNYKNYLKNKDKLIHNNKTNEINSLDEN